VTAVTVVELVVELAVELVMELVVLVVRVVERRNIRNRIHLINWRTRPRNIGHIINPHWIIKR
jgi:hypothetical protein